jgi:tetratricopeptide (TPR) repeat protein
MNRLIFSRLLLCFVMALTAQSAYSQTATALNLAVCKTWFADDDYQRVIVWMDSVSKAQNNTLIADTKAVQLYGRALQVMGIYDKAIALYHERLALDSTDTECAHALGVCLNVIGRYKDAVVLLEKSWERDRQNYRILRSVAEALFNDKQFERARGYYALLVDKSRQGDTRNVQLYTQIARCYANEEDDASRKEAQYYYVLVGYELAPTNRALVMESVEFLRGAKALYGAMTVLDKAVQTFPNDAGIHAERGKNLLLQRRYTEARSAFAQAVALGGFVTCYLARTWGELLFATIV